MSKKYDQIMANIERDRLEREAYAAAKPVAAEVPQVANSHGTIQMDRASGRAYTMIANIVPDPDQPRKYFDEEAIRQKALSIKADGQLQPLIVEWNPELAKWVIVDGEMRWLALQAAGMDRAWCMFKHKKMTPAERLKTQLQANCLRDGLRGIELANAIKRLMDLTGCTQTQAAAELHMSQTKVSKTLKFLELPPSIQADMIAGKIPPSVAEQLSHLDSDEQEIIRVEYLAEEVSHGDVSDAVKKKKAAKRKGTPATKASKIMAHKVKEWKGTIVFKKPPTDEQKRAALLAWLDSLPDEKRDAA